SPDDVIDRYGADAMRLYELFMGPLEQVKPWQMTGVAGVSRFLERVWRLIDDRVSDAADPALEKSLARTIQKVEADTLALRFNTAISQMMTFVNDATVAKKLPRSLLEHFACVLSPYAPHLAEELWEKLGHQDLVCQQAWPKFDPALVVDDVIPYAVQVNGKLKAEIRVAVN